MQSFIDLTGKQFGRFTVLRRDGVIHRGQPAWICLCACGTERRVNGQHLRTGHTTSCGCRQRTVRLRHGMTNSPTYSVWECMVQRVLNPKHKHYKYYGERGVTMHPSWRDFQQFLADMGERPTGLTLERIDNAKGYEPGNCKWATRKEQARNTRLTVFVEYQGRRQSLPDWADELGITLSALSRRHKRGWTVERMFAAPLRAYRKRVI